MGLHVFLLERSPARRKRQLSILASLHTPRLLRGPSAARRVERATFRAAQVEFEFGGGHVAAFADVDATAGVGVATVTSACPRELDSFFFKFRAVELGTAATTARGTKIEATNFMAELVGDRSAGRVGWLTWRIEN